MVENTILFLMKKGRILNNLLLDPVKTWMVCFGGRNLLGEPRQKLSVQDNNKQQIKPTYDARSAI